MELYVYAESNNKYVYEYQIWIEVKLAIYVSERAIETPATGYGDSLRTSTA